MLIRVVIILLIMTVCALALHEHTFPVFELFEELQMRYMNMWELLEQLKYVTPEQRVIVYEEIEAMKKEIELIVDQILQQDRQQHPQ